MYTSIKRKINTQTTRLGIPETQEIPLAMDVYELIEEHNRSMQRLLETREIIEALITQELEIFEEESITFHHATYDQVSKKLVTRKI
jgi:hypothetical protein